MSWINLERLLLDGHPDRPVSLAPALDQVAVRARALSFAAALQARLPDAIVAASCLDFTPPAILVTENDLDFRYEENGIQKIVAGLLVERVG